MRKLLFAVLWSLSFLSSAASNFTFSNSPGPLGVGLRVVNQYDYTRAYGGNYDLITGQPTQGDRARPLQTVIWYPAQKAGKAMTYGDYLLLGGTEEQLDRTPEEASRAAAQALAVMVDGMSAEQVEREKARPMWAVKDARPVTGRFPVVIYAPSFSASAFENADLCEYLASQGYLVIATPALGAHSRIMTADLEGIETQVGDIEFLIGYARSLPQADTSQVAVIGYSWGGISNVFAAAKDSRITALICLDGSVRYFPELVKEARYVTPARVAIPLLYLSQRPQSLEEMVARKRDVSSSFMNQLKYSDFYKVTLYPMNHGDFASLPIRFDDPERFQEFSAEEVSQAHSWMARYVHQFLNAYLKRDPAGLAFMNNPPAKNAVPAHMLAVEARRGSGAPPTLEALAAELGRHGFGHALEVYNDTKKRDPGFAIPEISVAIWGEELLAGGKAKEAVEIFKLYVSLYPDSAHSYDSLAGAYERTGEPALAIKNYKRSLELNPKNDNAVRHLKKLDPAGAKPSAERLGQTAAP